MTLVSDRETLGSGVPDAEALFKEAKRRERKRRLFVGAIVIVIVATAVAVIDSGGGGRRPSLVIHRSHPAPSAIGTDEKSWTATSLLEVALPVAPVVLPGTPFAYAIEEENNPSEPESQYGHLIRIDLVSGAVKQGPIVPMNSQLFVLGTSMALLTSPTTVDKNASARHLSPYVLREVIGATVSLGAVHDLALPDELVQVVPQTGPLDAGGEFWIGFRESAYVLDAANDTITGRVAFGTGVSSIAVSPNGTRVYVALNELEANPVTRDPTVLEELNGATRAVLRAEPLPGAELGFASLDAVSSGVWASYKGGMDGVAVLLEASNLSIVTPIRDLQTRGVEDYQAPIPTAGQTDGGAVSVTPLGETVLLTSATGTSCVVQASGRPLAGIAFPSTVANGPDFWQPFAGDSGHVYATQAVTATGLTRVLTVKTPESCR
jgi:hypothetical protein